MCATSVTADDVLSDDVQLADEILVVIIVPMASFVHVKRAISRLLVDISSLLPSPADRSFKVDVL